MAGGPRGYGRYANPTWEAFELAMGSLDEGEAVAFASGMGAVSATAGVVLDGAPSTGAVVVPADGYHTSISLLSDTGRPVRPVRLNDTAAVVEAVPGAALVWLEVPSNPLLDVPDVAAICARAHDEDVPVVVDATAATPLLARPLADGADVVVHAATKYVAGHSDLLMGVATAADSTMADRLREHRSRHGAIPGAFEAWLALRGLRTLPVRMERASATAAVLAERLGEHAGVARVRYPGWGALVAIDVAGGAQSAATVCTSTRLWVHATSFGGVESTLERRRRWASERAVVPESLLRLSVGLEDVEDLWEDLDAALTQT